MKNFARLACLLVVICSIAEAGHRYSPSSLAFDDILPATLFSGGAK